jgi:hypothetical protein
MYACPRRSTAQLRVDAHRRMAANEATGKLVVLPRAATA